MPTRTLSLVILTALLAFGSPVSATDTPNTKKAATKAAPAKASTTWKALVDHAASNGMNRELTAPLSRNLGFDSDAVMTKAMRIKAESSPDKLDHTIYVAYSLGPKKEVMPTSVVLAKNKSSDSKDGPFIQSFFIRLDTAGKVLNALRSKGLKGHVVPAIADPTEESIKTDSEYEKTYFLKTIKLEQLGNK